MSSLRKGPIARRFGLPRLLSVVSLSTVASGNIYQPNSCKPYFYNGYYYVFYKSDSVIYYRTSPDGETWSDAVSVDSVIRQWTVMGIDDKILLIRSNDDYHKTRVGTIQDDHTISWGADADLGITDARLLNRRSNCYVTKVAGARKLFALLTSPGSPGWNATPRVYVSDDDGESWTALGYCNDFGGYHANQYMAVPFNDGNKLQEIYTMVWITGVGFLPLYQIHSKFRDDTTCSSLVTLDGFRNQYYSQDQAVAIFDGTYVNLFYIDDSNNLLHQRIQAEGTWEMGGTVKAGIDSDAGVTAIYDPMTELIHIIYWEDTTIYYKTWNGSVYSDEKTLVTDESDILRLTAYPNPINHRFLLIWQDATPNIRFARLRRY